jgi:hypothetical protein
MADDKDGTFKVTDRRAFNADGSPRADGPAPAADAKADGPPEPGKVVDFPGAFKKDTTHESSDDRSRAGRPADFPPATFDSFINMLAVETLMHLGLIPNPMDETRRVDLNAAKHLIETLLMLREKTRGNLTQPEADMLENVVAELQLQFVASTRTK